MPIEIHELIIRAEIAEGAPRPRDPGQAVANALNHEELIGECVRQVLATLAAKDER